MLTNILLNECANNVTLVTAHSLLGLQATELNSWGFVSPEARSNAQRLVFCLSVGLSLQVN